jgi:hypothetical protein
MSALPERGSSSPWARLGHAAFGLAVLVCPAHSQAPPQLLVERQAFSEWLARAPTSPTAIVARSPIGAGLTVGPAAADLPLDGISGRVVEDGSRVVFTDSTGAHTVPRAGTIRIGRYLFAAAGPKGRALLLVYGEGHKPTPVTWYSYDQALVFTVDLKPPATATRRLRLDADATEVEALDAGRVHVPLGGAGTEMTVYDMGGRDADSPELTVYFQDRTNGHGSYPAGRFVELVPVGAHYLLDFNRARNPYCAYSTIYPCPAPWPGNLIDASVTAGERYGTAGGEGAP